MAIVERIPSSKHYDRQWIVDGSKGNKYVVSMKEANVAHGHSSYVEWSCACKSWTSISPRLDCKHILLVRLMLLEKDRKGVAILLPGDVCPNCGGESEIGRFIKTGQSGFGEVYGYTCTHEFHELKRKLEVAAKPKRRIKL